MDHFMKRIQDAAFKIDLTEIPEEDKQAILKNFKELKESPEQKQAVKERIDQIVAEAICEYYENKR